MQRNISVSSWMSTNASYRQFFDFEILTWMESRLPIQ